MKYLFCLLAATALWSAEEFTRTIEKQFSLTGDARTVYVCGMNGSIRVTTSNTNEVRFVVNPTSAV